VPRSTLERKLVVGVLVLFLIPTLVAGAIMVVLYRRGVFHDLPALILTVIIGFAAMMGYLGTMTHAIGRALVRTLLEIQRGTELMATVNPAYRHRVDSGDELQAVAEEINRMADRLRDARVGLETEVARTTRDLQAERAKLSAILGELDEGVVVATLEGRITLANRAAQRLLGGEPLLGQSLFGLVDRETVAHFLDRLRVGQGAAERFMLHPAGGRVLQAGMTSLVAREGEATGFILALRDVSRSAREDEALRHRLDGVFRDLRGPLSSIRSLSESLLDDQAPPAQPLLSAIHSEAVRLSDLIRDVASPSQRGLVGAPWHFEEVAVADLLRMTLRRFTAEGGDGTAVEVMAGEPGLPSLQVDVSALSAAVAHLVRVVSTWRPSGGRSWLKPLRRGAVLQIDVGVEGSATVTELEAGLDAPITVGERRFTVRHTVHRHAGEVWAFAGGGGNVGFRLTLPLDEGRTATVVADEEAARAPRFVGAGTVSGSGGRPPIRERTDLYDFSFFDQMERHVLPSDRECRLEALTFVVLDSETTGLRPEDGHRIVSLAGVKIRDATVRRSEIFDALVNPGRAVPAESSRFHGLTDEMLADAPPIEVVLPAFERFAEGAVLVGHEIWFDLRFLSRAADRIGLPSPAVAHAILDARLLSQAVHRAESTHTLDAVAGRLGVVVEGRHSALGDALATAEIFVRLLSLLEKRGIVTLGQALDAARAARGRWAGSRDPA
jgi:DNA polymerase-3 subunit epsilon